MPATKVAPKQTKTDETQHTPVVPFDDNAKKDSKKALVGRHATVQPPASPSSPRAKSPSKDGMLSKKGLSVKDMSVVKGMSKNRSMKLVEAGTDGEGAFIRMPCDLGGLVLSGWLVPTVKMPFKYLPTFLIAISIEISFVCYIFDYLVHGWTTGGFCSTPALIQIVAVYVFGAGVFNGFTAHKAMQIAKYSTHLKSDERDDAQFLVRTTSERARRWLLLLTVADLLMETVVFLLGVVFVMSSKSTGDVVLNSLAVNFIAEVDEIMLGAFVNSGAKQRLEKYRFNVPVGVEEGDTKLTNATRMTKRLAWASARVPMWWIVGCAIIVGLGQAASASAGGECTFFSARRDVAADVVNATAVAWATASAHASGAGGGGSRG